MKRGKLRPWFALVGPLVAVVVLTAAPAGVKAGELPWPKWLVAGLVATGGVLVAVWTPLVKARTDALAARTTRAAERDAQAEEALSHMPTLNGKVLLVRDVSDRALLGIHEAIPLPADSVSAQALSTELPTYVLRDVDADLRTALEARSKTGGFVLLIGPAAAGKTRCAYEATRAVFPHWRLFMPPDSVTLTALVTGGTDLKHSVVWLNEAQNFLTGPDRLKAATVRRMLADTTRPVIIVGTIWPTTYDQLRTVAVSDDQNQDGQDLNKDAREVLELARKFSLGRWSDQEWQRAEELASVDPRIGQVLRHRGQAGMAQMLSAAPELIHRWEQADNPFGQAVITAAVVARRCNHPEPVPVPVIEALAKQLLTGSDRATARDSWLDDALTWACQPVHHSGGIAPLQVFGEAIGQVDGYQVSDILIDYKAPSAPISEEQIAATIWENLIACATPEACLSIGASAYFTGLADTAVSAWQRAADSQDIDAMFGLGILLGEQGDTDGARHWYTRAAEAGHVDSMVNLGVLLRSQGDTDGARHWYTRAIEAGDTDAMFNLGILLRSQGDKDGARHWYTRAIEAGNITAGFNLGNLLGDQGDTDGARHWYTRAAEADHVGSMVNLGVLLGDQGDTDGARHWYTRAAEAGDADAMVNLGVLLGDQGDKDGARHWYTRAAEVGNISAMFNLGNLLGDQGDTDSARHWYTRAAEADHVDSMVNLGVLLRSQGDTDGARHWYTRAAEAGDTDAMVNLGNLLGNQGDTDGARHWYTRAAEAGDTDAMFNLGVLLRSQGDKDGARHWYTRAAEAGDIGAATALSALNQVE